MLVIPVEQSTAGIGNTEIGKENYLASSIRNFHIVYENSDGSLYSGNNSAIIFLKVSNELATSKDDFKYALKLAEVTLTKDEPVQIYNFFEDASLNLICTVDSIVDGMVTIYPSPIKESHLWR